MKTRVTLSVVAVFVCVGIVSYALFMAQGVREPVDLGTVLEPLPTSPLGVTVEIDGQEVTLIEGLADVPLATESESRMHIEVSGAPVISDLNGDGTDDALLTLIRTDGGSGTFTYLAAALKDREGYLGTNAIFLGDRVTPPRVRVENAVVKAAYETHAEGQAFTDTPATPEEKYITLESGLLEEVVVDEGTTYLEGTLSYDADRWSFTPCGRDRGAIPADARSLTVLQVVYTERSKNDEGVFLIVLARVGEDEDTASYDITRVVAVPLYGVCGASGRDQAADTPAQQTTDAVATSTTREAGSLDAE